MTKKSLVNALSALVVGAVVLTGCADENSEAGGPGMGHGGGMPSAGMPGGQQGDHNQHDVAFAQQMIPHHAQAIEMARLAPERTSTEKVLDLARRIEQAQDPEIQQMTTWLAAWGASVPTTAPGHGGMGMDHGGMPGMMSAEEMRQLTQAKGAEFDRLFLTMMIEHHEGAVHMAQMELQHGSNTEARTLAQRIIDTQQAEIDEMRGLLSQD